MASIREKITKTGEKVFMVRVRVKGFKPVTKTFSRKTDAKLWGKETEVELKNGKFKQDSPKNGNKTVSDMIDKYISSPPREHFKRFSTRKYQLEIFKKKIGYMYVSEITPAVLNQLRKVLIQMPSPKSKIIGETVSPATVNRYFSTLSSVFQIALEEWEWVHSNPCRSMKRFKEKRTGGRCLSEVEYQKLYTYCKQNISQKICMATIFGLTLGMRRGEILALTWDDIDFGKCILTIHKTKNGRPRTIPIPRRVMSLVREYAKVRQLNTNLLFPSDKPHCFGKPFEVRNPWKKLLQELNITNFRFHDLRHTCASYLAMSGVNTRTIAEILGHQTIAMAMRYSHLNTGHLEEALSVMNRKLI